MTEREIREIYIKAMLDVCGAAPMSVFERPVSPLLQRFAELILKESVDKSAV
jgi:hypothetical protein